MFSNVITFGLSGTRSYLVNVETDIQKGIPNYDIVGMGAETIKESKKRIRSAIINQNLGFPMGHITQNLAPADIRKNGTGYDLPLALGILLSSKEIILNGNARIGVIGELSLDGCVCKVKGVLPALVCGKNNGINLFIVPKENLDEAEICPGVKVIGVNTIKDAYNCLISPEVFFKDVKENSQSKYKENENLSSSCDFGDVYGQLGAKRALVIAAAGKHNIMLLGSPGCGKTLMGRCFRGILPTMTFDEFFEVKQIYSSCGIENDIAGPNFRPFRIVHQSITKSALVGGGKPIDVGELSLAHNGVLFMDEFSELPKNVIESLRQPLEEKKVFISNYGVRETMPADFILVAAANPCPCGNLYEKKGKCNCYASQITRYQSKFSNAILDRIDMHVPMRSVESDKIGEKQKMTSSEMREIVTKARQVQYERYKDEHFHCNGDIDNISYVKACSLSKETRKILAMAVENYSLSVRGYTKAVKVARTIADIEGHDQITEDDILESLQYRLFNLKEQDI